MKLSQYLKRKGFLNNEINELIENNKIIINKQLINNLDYEIKNHDKIEIGTLKTWVSRGALKLVAAIEKFKISFKDKIILDIGSSTGGFTDVSLSYGAKKVYALDVGTNQLAYKLRIDPRVVVYEKTHLKLINQTMFEEKIDIIVCDVAFISLTKVFPVLKVLKHNNLKLIILIKPQFEALKQQVVKGYVEEKYHRQILQKIHTNANDNGFKLIKLIASPIKGQKAQNIEYIAYYEVENAT